MSNSSIELESGKNTVKTNKEITSKVCFVNIDLSMRKVYQLNKRHKLSSDLNENESLLLEQSELRFSIAAFFQVLWDDFLQAQSVLPRWERLFRLFWLLGPFVLLVERTPADIWISVIAISFVVRSIWLRQGWWLKLFWVKAAFLFWGSCLVASSLSSLPFYSLGEAIAWFRFPLFAMAVTFWLATERAHLYAMFLALALSTLLMVGILVAEILIVGAEHQRLSWPYGDLVPGNYLSKACLPIFLVAAALATASMTRVAGIAAIFVLISSIASFLTGERINFLIRMCAGGLAAIVWKPQAKLVVSLIVVLGLSIALVLQFNPGIGVRFVNHFMVALPIYPESLYFRSMGPGWLAFEQSPIFGIGTGNLRYLCEAVINNSPNFDCHPHPHNFYLQLLGETGFIVFVFGCVFLWSIVWTCVHSAILDRSNVIISTMWIVPFAFFWPVASTADFFGQWHNIFMWSAVALALAAARNLSSSAND